MRPRASSAEAGLSSEQRVAKELGRVGVGESWKRQVAGGLVDQFEREGFDAGAATQVVARVMASGTPVPVDEMRRLIQAVESGAVAVGGTDARSSYGWLTESFAKLTGDAGRTVNAGLQMRFDTAAMPLREAERGVDGFLQQWMKSQGMSDEQVAQMADPLRRLLLAQSGQAPITSAGDVGNEVYALAARLHSQRRGLDRMAEGYAGRGGGSHQMGPWSGSWLNPYRPDPRPRPPGTPDPAYAAQERVESILQTLEDQHAKATTSPEELVLADLQAAGASTEQMQRARDLISRTAAAKAAANGAAKSAVGPRSAATVSRPPFDPDAQNASPTVINQTFSGHVVIGDSMDPRKRRGQRSPVR